MTTEHCAYCDAFPVAGVSHETIDHFRPKSVEAFEHLAFEWDNLFYACDCCQGHKRERFDDALLRPDDVEYRFERYFVYDPDTGYLRPRPGASSHDVARAASTITLLGLNEDGRPASRMRAVRHLSRAASGAVDLRDHPYRFALIDALPG